LLYCQAHADRDGEKGRLLLRWDRQADLPVPVQGRSDPDIGAKAKASAKLVGTLYGYRTAVVNNLSRNLLALGLEKAPPKVKSLEEILSEGENEEESTWVGVHTLKRVPAAAALRAGRTIKTRPTASADSWRSANAESSGGSRSVLLKR
jgi:hypothetical protein